MLMPEKEEKNLFIYDLDFDCSKSIFSYNQEDNIINKNDLTKVESKNIFKATLYQKKISKKKEVNFLTQKYNNNDEKKGVNLRIKDAKNFKSLDINSQINKINIDIASDIIYRKDAYYKHFKVNFGKYIKNRMNILKNRCFPYYNKNNFSTPNYKYIGNPKEKDNFNFLSFTIKEILIYGKDKDKFNRQYNNEQLINFIEENKEKTNDKIAYKEIIQFLNSNIEDAIKQYYDDEKEFDKIKNDKKYIFFDKYYQRENGISLLEKYGFLKALKQYNSKIKIS